MKLQTSILPRRDGTVTLTAKDGQKCVFAPGPDGELVGDVHDEATVAELINGGMFFPADPADFDEALALTGKSFDGSDVLNAADGGDPEGDPDLDPDLDPDANDPDGDDPDLDPEGDVPPNTPLPVEANTPPAAAPKAAKNGGGKKVK